MAVCGCISVANLNCHVGTSSTRNISKLGSPMNNSDGTISLSFGGSESMGLSLRLASTLAAKGTRLRRNHGSSPLRVVCTDYPRPELENTVNFLEAAYLSSTFRASPRPTKPLKVIVAGAGNNKGYIPHFV